MILYLLVALVISFILSRFIVLEQREIKEMLDGYETILSRNFIKGISLIVVNLIALFWIIVIPFLIIDNIRKNHNVTK